VGTVTEIYDYMRLLFARVGNALFAGHRPADRKPDGQPDGRPRDGAAEEGTRLYLLAPIVRGRKGEYRKELAELMKQGFQRVKVDGEFYEIADAPPLDKKFKHDIDVVVDRIVVREDIAARLADSLRPASGLPTDWHRRICRQAAAGRGNLGRANKARTRPMSACCSLSFACPVSGFTISEIEPRLFSFNNPHGACPTCDGLGTQLTIRRGADRPRAERCPCADGAMRPGPNRQHLALLHADAGSHLQALRLRCQTLERPARERCRMPSCAAPARKITFVYDDGCASYRPRNPSKA
jgi:excinuclease ABC subunit A